jgi:vacuolar-type H+-ATPase subunit H
LSRAAFTASATTDELGGATEPVTAAADADTLGPDSVGLDGGAPAEELAELRARVHDLEAALAAAVDSPGVVVGDARERARRMLDRADAACLEMRERATDDADRVRAAATTASLEIMSSAERDSRAMLERARRDSEALLARARQVADTAEEPRPTLRAVPGLDEADNAHNGSNGVAATS